MAKKIANIGIVGAGSIGRTLASRAVSRGYQVMLSNSRGADSLTLIAAELKCKNGTPAEAAQFGDLVVVTIPFRAIESLDPQPFAGKVVVDTCNHYPGRDGPDAALDAMLDTTGERLQRHLSSAHVVKAFNAIMQADIERHARPRGALDRRALPIAGDDLEARGKVAGFIDDLGFDVVDAGPLAECWRFERAMPAYCIPFGRQALASALAKATVGERLPEGSWRTPHVLVQ